MESLSSGTDWRRCSSCKKPIAYKALYWVCNVSTCNRKRTGLVFCDVSCWDAHLPLMNHRESWAEERKAPSRDEWAQIQAAEAEPKRRVRKAPEPGDAQRDVAAAPKPQASTPKVVLRRPGGNQS